MAEIHLTHGFSRKGRKHPLYLCWESIKSRCYIPSSSAWKHYGARGIRMCPEWQHDAKAFIDWAISAGWQVGLEIDRRNNNGDYAPDNCRFVTRKVNMRNTRTNRLITAFGETKPLPAWTEDARCCVKTSTIRTRLAHGYTTERAIAEPPHHFSTGRTVSVVLSAAHIEAIRDCIQAGKSQAKIARRYHLSTSRMHRLYKQLRAEVYQP